MALNANALTTVPKLRQWLSQGLTDEADGRLGDAALEGLINRASAAIEGWCDRALIAPAAAVTYRLNGDGGQRIVLPEWPVVSVSAVTIEGEAIPERTELVDIGYLVRSNEGWLSLVGRHFPVGQDNVVVSARLDYDRTLAATDRRHRRALDDLDHACLMLCRHWWEKPEPARLTGGLMGSHDTWQVIEVPAEVQALLHPYRRWGA